MAKELYLYSPIYDFVAQQLMQQMEENKGEAMTMRMNTPGGSVFAGWGVVAKMKEVTGAGSTIHAKCDGIVASMGIPLLCYATTSEALEVTMFMIHKASMYISNDEDQQLLDIVNKDLRAKLNKKIDNVKLKELKGFTIDDIFDAEDNKEIYLTAKEAKKIGLINKVVPMNPSEMNAFNTNLYKLAAMAETPEDNKPKPNNPITMTLDELKTKHPDVYAQLLKQGNDAGITAERARIGAWMAWNKVDPEAVAAAIKDGKEISMQDISEFTVKALSGGTLKNMAAESAKAVVTDEAAAVVQETEAKKMENQFLGSVSQHLGLTNKLGGEAK